MSTPGLVWGYSQHGYDVLARTSQLEPWIESLFLDVGERWPFSEERESLVLTHFEETRSGACCVLAKSRMSLGEPAHRQTVFALFRADELAQRWSGLLPLVGLLPPYTPKEGVLPDINLGILETDSFAVPRSSNCEVSWHDPQLNRKWLLDTWLRLTMEEVIELPSCNNELEQEILVADLLASTLPAECRVKIRLSLGMRQRGTLTVGPGITSAGDTSPNNSPQTYRQPQSRALKKWLDQAVAECGLEASLEKTVSAIQDALDNEARQAGLASVTNVDVDHLVNVGQRHLLNEAEDHIRWDTVDLPKILRAIRERLNVSRVYDHGLMGERLARVVGQMEPSLLLNTDLARETAELLFELGFGIPPSMKRMLHVPPATKYARIPLAGLGFSDTVEVYYWRVTTSWLTKQIHSGDVDIGPLLARPWSEEKCRFDHQDPSFWSFLSRLFSRSKRAWDMLIDASGCSDLRRNKAKIEEARPATNSYPMEIEYFVEAFVAATLEIAPHDVELRDSICELLRTMQKRNAV